MSVLRLASRETKRLDVGDNEFVEVRTELSKKDFNILLKLLPPDYDSEKGFSPGQADDFMTALFGALVTGWSLVDENENAVPASVENYMGLVRDGSNAIDEKLIEHFNALQPTPQETSKSKGTSK